MIYRSDEGYKTILGTRYMVSALTVLLSIDLFVFNHLRSDASTAYHIFIFPASIAILLSLTTRRSFVSFISGVSIIIISSILSNSLFYSSDPKGMSVGMFTLLIRTSIFFAVYLFIAALVYFVKKKNLQDSGSHPE